MLNNQNKLLIIAGNGQNIGKTQLACDIISIFSEKEEIISVKVSSHFHKLTDKENILVNKKEYTISKEVNKESNKDSSRMLQAGASKVYYIQTKDEFILDAYKNLLRIIGTEKYIVCESGGLAYFVNAGVFLLIKDKNKTSKNISKLEKKATRIISSENNKTQFNIKTLSIAKNKWFVKKYNYSAAILSGGKASRFGGIDKGLVEINGQKIIERTYNILNEIFEEIFIISNTKDAYKNIITCQTYPDIIPNLGPIGGLLTALEKSTKSAIFLIANDMPFINSNIIIEEIEMFNKVNTKILIPKIDNGNQPLHALYSTEIKGEIKNYINSNNQNKTKKESSLSLRNVCREFPTKYIKIDSTTENKLAFSNINSVSDLEKII